MSLQWDGFLPDTRAGNVAGTFYYFDTEAQPIIIRGTDNALTSTYDDVELGQWLDAVWENNLRIGNFGLSQFVPRHNYNGEIWAVGITPTTVPAETGRHPTPAHPAGFYVYRYKYYEDLTNILDSFDTSEQSENQIKDAGAEIKNIGEEELNKTSSIFAPGSRIVGKLGMGNSSKMYLSTTYVDEISWEKAGESMRLSGRNAIGYYLSEQTFDESVQYAGTRTSVLRDILLYSGVDMTKVFVEEHEWPMTALFQPTDTLFYGINHLIDIFGWRMMELPNGKIVIGSQTYCETFAQKVVHQFRADEVFTRGLTLRGDGAYSRIALQSSISEDPGPPVVPAFTRTVYKDLPFFDGWGIGGRKTLYITILPDQSEADMITLADEYAKAYQYIGVNLTREIPIHPEIQSGDVIEITDGDSEEYITRGIVTGVNHRIDVAGGEAHTILSIDSGGTIEEDSTVKTYTAADVTGDTRRRELIDVIRKAAQEKKK